MINKTNHHGLSIREKLLQLLKPSVAIQLVLVQKHELEKIMAENNNFRACHYSYVEQLYQHYIVENKTKMYLHN